MPSIKIFPENVIPIDSKSIRASSRYRKNLRALHIVSAFSCANGISLGQMIMVVLKAEMHCVAAYVFYDAKSKWKGLQSLVLIISERKHMKKKQLAFLKNCLKKLNSIN